MTKKKLIILSIILLITNIILSILNSNGSQIRHLDGTIVEPNSIGLITSLLIGNIISIPIICLLLSFITAIFIDKKKPYRERYLKGFLITLTIVYGFITIMGLIKIIIN